MATQDMYRATLRPAVAGQRATQIPATMISRNVETVAGLGLGLPVAQGVDDKGCKLFDGGTVLGITVRERSLTAEENKFLRYESARIMTEGDIWAVCTTGCNAGDPVYARPSNATWQTSSANSGVQWVGARWDTSAEPGELAVIRRG